MNDNDMIALQESLVQSCKKLVEMRFLHSSNQLKDTAKIRLMRRNIANYLTRLRQYSKILTEKGDENG